MLHLPRIIESKLIRENDLVQCFLEQAVFVTLVPGAG